VSRICCREILKTTRLGYMSVAVFTTPTTLAGALSITAPIWRMNVVRSAARRLGGSAVRRFGGALRTAGLGISRTLRSLASRGGGAASCQCAR
jgi:hypothetical protein